jgi:hypothetical protein
VLIHLLDNPWATVKLATIEAENVNDWARTIAEIPPPRVRPGYAAAVVIEEFDPTGKPFVVQVQGTSNDAAHLRDVVDGTFLIVKTGLISRQTALLQWEAITMMQDFLGAYEQFIGGSMANVVRRAVYPSPKIITDKA